MIIQKIFAHIVRIISSLLRCSRSGSSSSEEGKGPGVWEHLYTFGPRVLVVRDGKLLRLTGIFSVIITYGEKGELESCNFFLLTREPGDETYFGREAQLKCQELCPRPDYSNPMFTDGSTSFG